MKNKLIPLDYCLVDSAFKDLTGAFVQVEEGNYTISTLIGDGNSGEKINIEILSDGNDQAHFVMPVEFTINGYKKEDNEEKLAFSLQCKIKVRFVLLAYDPSYDGNILESNRHFIESHVRSVTAMIAQRQLEVTKYRSIEINLSLL